MDSKQPPPPPQSTPSQPPVIGVPVGSTASQYRYHGNPEIPLLQPQYPQNTPAHHHHSQWSTGLFDCCDDVPNCCITMWCPCITFGQISEIVDRGHTSCGANAAIYVLLQWITGCECLYAWFYRAKMRRVYGLQGSHLCDGLAHWICNSCALCQEYRELQNRGFELTIGWEGNMQRQNYGGAAADPLLVPVVEGGMSR